MTQDRAFAIRDTFLPFARPSITDDDVAAVGEVLAAIRDVLGGGR